MPPEATHLDGAPLTRLELKDVVVGDLTFGSFAIARSGDEGYRTHPDPDSRAGAQSWFMVESKVKDLVVASLRAGVAVEITVGGHCILIYGADIDAGGQAQRYYIKDSYPDYFYTADPQRTLDQLVEMTTVKLL